MTKVQTCELLIRYSFSTYAYYRRLRPSFETDKYSKIFVLRKVDFMALVVV